MDKNLARLLVPRFFVFFVFFVNSIGGLVLDLSEGMSVSAFRSMLIPLILMVLIFFSLVLPKFLVRSSLFFWFVAFALFYAFVVSVGSGRFLESLSPLLRLMIFILTVEIVRRFYLIFDGFSEMVGVLYKAIILFSLFYVGFDWVLGKTQFLNGAYRSDANIGSPIGFSAYIAVCFLGLTYLWLAKGRSSYIIFALIGLLLVFFSGTRSVSVMCTIFLFLSIFMRQGFGRNVFIVFPFLLLAGFLLFHYGILSSLLDRFFQVASGDLDASGLFRVFIVETFISYIQATELVFGLGLGGFYMWFENQTGIANVAPHFEVLWLLSEFGLVFGLLYFLVLAFCFFSSIYILYKSKKNDGFAFLTIASLFSHMLVFQLANPFYFYEFILVFGVLVGLYLAEYKRQGRLLLKSNSG